MSARRPQQQSRQRQKRGLPQPGAPSRTRWLLAGGGVVIAVVAVLAGIALLSAGPSGSGTASAPAGRVVQGAGGHWTDVTPNTLASMLQSKDFTLLNVKTPYIGEISGTDLYIPYTSLPARAAELPSDKGALIVVYCRSGAESAVAAQTLLDLGYANIANLDGGMTAWVAGGRALVQLNRT